MAKIPNLKRYSLKTLISKLGRILKKINNEVKMSYLNNFKIIKLFLHKYSFDLLAPTMSLINEGQFFGHSCLTI